LENPPTLSGIVFFCKIWGFSQNSGVSLLVGFCVAPMRASEKTTQGNYICVFRGVFGGVGFAHSHARGPVLGSSGGAPGYSKINQSGIIINTGRAPEPFSSCFSKFEIFDFFHSTLPYRNKMLQNGP
jgi:hypothetical protein